MADPPPDAKRPYSRVYWEVVDDPRFDGIYGDNDHLATWLRLLLIADAAWPMSPPIPRTTQQASLDVLVSCGLVELCKDDHFRIHGLDSERERRSAKGRPGGIASGKSRGERTLNDRSTAPRKVVEPDETRRDETRRDAQSARDGVDMETWGTLGKEAERLTGQAYVLGDPYAKMGQKVLGLAATFGVPAILNAWRAVAALHDPRPTLRQLVFEGESIVAPIDDHRDEERQRERDAVRQREIEANERKLVRLREMMGGAS